MATENKTLQAAEKAEQLIHEHRMILMQEDTDCGHELLCTIIGIKSALVTANEMHTRYLERLGATDSEVAYWEDVIKELQSY